MKKKAKWPVNKLLAREQRILMRRWLRHAENLNDTEEDLIHIFEP
jgi:hypothetical protein